MPVHGTCMHAFQPETHTSIAMATVPAAVLWGAPRAVPALCQKQAILDPLSRMANLTAVTTVSPYAGLLRFLLSPKTQITTQIIFPLQKLLLSKSAVFALWT